MNKLSFSSLTTGQLVVTNGNPDTQVYTVACVEGRVIYLQWREGSHVCSQGVDGLPLFEPTIQQIQNSIANNGALVSINDIAEFSA